MKLVLDQISKEFNGNSLFRPINANWEAPARIGIAGKNGSGKSTLVKIISGFLSPSSGKIVYQTKNGIVSPEEIYRKIAIAAPYCKPFLEGSVSDTLQYHFRFKKLDKRVDLKNAITNLGFSTQLEAHQLSSGMLQKLKLLLAFWSDTEILILDEPTEFLDQDTVGWYFEMLKNFSKNKLVLIASNNQNDFMDCKEIISIAK